MKEKINRNKGSIVLVVLIALVIGLVAWLATGENTPKDMSTISCENISSELLTDYKTAACSQDINIVYIMRDGCSYCEMMQPIINEVVKENKLNIVTIDIAKLDEAGYNELNSTNMYLKNTEWGTPTTLIVQNGKVINALVGYREKDVLVEFFKANSVMK